MKKILSCIIVSTALLLFFVSSYAETSIEKDVGALYQFTGTAKSLGSTHITVSSKVARDITRTVIFLITKATIIHGKLTRGSTVHVTYRINRDGKHSPARTALVIRVIEINKQKSIQGK